MAAERDSKEQQLKQLWRLYKADQIDLYFGDESTFSMNPVLPYCWQPKDKRIEIFPQRDKKVNLFGVFRPDSFCIAYECTKNVNSEFLIESVDDFCQYLNKPTVLVLDNAPTHRSRKFPATLERRQEKVLYIFFLPRYSPHLNLAETFWRKAKYEWLKPADYAWCAKFKRQVYRVFNSIGLEYKIKFKEMMI